MHGWDANEFLYRMVKFVVPRSGILALGWIQYGDIVKMYWLNHITFSFVLSLSWGIKSWIVIIVILSWYLIVKLTTLAGYVAEIGAFCWGGGGVINIAIISNYPSPLPTISINQVLFSTLDNKSGAMVRWISNNG